MPLVAMSTLPPSMASPANSCESTGASPASGGMRSGGSGGLRQKRNKTIVSPKSDSQFQCSVCSKLFSSGQALGGHQNAHRYEQKQLRSTFPGLAPDSYERMQIGMWSARLQQPRIVGPMGMVLAPPPPPPPAVLPYTGIHPHYLPNQNHPGLGWQGQAGPSLQSRQPPPFAATTPGHADVATHYNNHQQHAPAFNSLQRLSWPMSQPACYPALPRSYRVETRKARCGGRCGPSWELSPERTVWDPSTRDLDLVVGNYDAGFEVNTSETNENVAVDLELRL